MNRGQTTFDPTVCFTFFGSWVKSIESLETEQDHLSKAYLLFKAIADYSMYGKEPDFQNEPLLNALWILIENELDVSMNRRKRNFANDEMNEKKDKIINAIICNPTASLRELAEITGISKSTIDRVKKKYQKEIEEAIVRNSGNSSDGVSNGDNDVGCDVNSGNDVDSGNDIGTGTMGRDSETDFTLPF